MEHLTHLKTYGETQILSWGKILVWDLALVSIHTTPWWDTPVDAFIPFILTSLPNHINCYSILRMKTMDVNQDSHSNKLAVALHLCIFLIVQVDCRSNCHPGMLSLQSRRVWLQCRKSWQVLMGNKIWRHWSQSQPQHGGVALVTNENHLAPLCYTQMKPSLSHACLVSKVKTLGDGLSATMWPQLEEYRKHCLWINSWCHQTYSRCEFGTVTQIPACDWGLLLIVSDYCSMG